jgi:hypothetical protein
MTAPTLDDAVAHAQAFVAAEHAANQAILLAPVFRMNSQKALWALVDMSALVVSLVHINPKTSPAEKKRKAAALSPRRIFLVQRFKGGVFGIIVGDDQGGGEYWDWYFAKEQKTGQKKKLMIVGVAHGCLDCEVTGTITKGPLAGTSCKICETGMGWDRVGGEIDPRKLGAALETRKLEAPTDPLHKKLWDKC